MRQQAPTAQETKHCLRCGETKATTEFYRDCWRSDGLTVYCGQCLREGHRRWYREHPEYRREISERSRRKRGKRIQDARHRWRESASHALDLRLQGKTYRQIASELGMPSVTTAWSAIRAELQRRGAELVLIPAHYDLRPITDGVSRPEGGTA